MPIRIHNQDGFTLLELMVVIAIISILAAFSAPTFIRQITKAKLVEAQNLATQNQSLVEEYILVNGEFPNQTRFQQLTQPLADDSIVNSIDITNQNNTTGNIVITLNSDTGIEDGQYIKYTRDDDQHWTCQSDLSAAVLPPQCNSVSKVKQ